MNSPVEKFLEAIRVHLFDAKIETSLISVISSVIAYEVAKYEITPKEVSLTVYDGGDGDLLKKFFIAKAVQGCTERTLTTYRITLAAVFSKIGKHLKDISSNDISAYLGWLRLNKKSSAYMALHHRTLSSFFTYCKKMDYIESNPMDKVERIKVRYRTETALTLEQMEAVRSAATTKRNKAFIEMLYSTGCRISELCALDRKDVDWDNLQIEVLGKGKKYRTVYITQRAKYAYKEYLKVRKDKSPALFGYEPELSEGQAKSVRALTESSSGNKVYDPDQGRLEPGIAETLIRSIGKKLGFRLHPHLIRKTMATQAMMRGMPIDEVRVMLGHESISTTTIYAQTLKDNVKESHLKFL